MKARSSLGLLLILFVIAAASACDLVRSAANAPGDLVNAVLPGGKPDGPPIEQLLPDVLRFADRLMLRIDEATREFEAATNTTEGDIQAVTWRIEVLRRSTDIATEPSSITALLDMQVAVTLGGWLQEDYWIPEVWGERARPMAIAYDRSVQDGWILIERYLNKPEVDQARALLKDWRDQNPRMSPSTLLDFPSFAKLLAKHKPPPGSSQSSSNLLSVVGLDPLSGLAPAARQVELARQFGERSLFFLQRAPRLLLEEVDLKTLQLRESPEAQQLLLDEQRITASIETITRTAASLPDVVRVEREEAVNQIARVVTEQREGLMKDLETAQPGMTTLMSETRDALVAATQFSAQATETIGVLDHFVASVTPTEPEPPPPPTEPPAKPFEISELGTSAEQIGVAARDVTSLLAGVDQSLPEVQRILDEAALRGEQTVDHVLRRALLTGLVLIGATALATLLVRWTSARLHLRRTER